MEEQRSLEAIVNGRVQGVFFRHFVQMHAEQLGLNGYVCNLPDGSVEIKAEGDKERLLKLLDYLKTGPPAASVEEVKAEWSASIGKYTQFEVRY
jgi:acylphosphatase